MRVCSLPGTCTGRTLSGLWNIKANENIIGALSAGGRDPNLGIVIATVQDLPRTNRMRALRAAGFEKVGTYAGVHGQIAVMIKGLSPKGHNSKA